MFFADFWRFLFILIIPFSCSLISKHEFVFVFVFVIVCKFSREFFLSDDSLHPVG